MLPEEVLSVRWVHDPQLSPGGDLLAFCVFHGGLSDIRLMAVEGGTHGNLTVAGRCPRWSPDGRYLAFVSEGDRSRLYVLRPDLGEARAVADFELGSFWWSPDGGSIALLKQEGGQGREEDIVVVDEEVQFQHIYIVDLTTRKVARLTSGEFHVLEFRWSPSGDRIAAVTAPTPVPEEALLGRKAELKLISPEDGKVLRDLEARGCPTSPAWSPDGRTIAFLDRGNELGWPDSLFVTSLDEGTPQNLTEGYEGTVLWADWVSNEELLLLVCEDLRSRVRLLDVKTGEMKEVIDESAYDLSPRQISLEGKKSSFVFTAETTTSPPDVWTFDMKRRSLRRLTEMNPRMELGKVEAVRWKSSDGLEISGVLVEPVGYDPEERYPLVVIPHGGPLSSWQLRWSDTVYSWGQLLAEEGFLVLLANQRGGLGRGSKFVDSLMGDIGGKELDDILSGVDFLVQRGKADPERIGIGGVSHGGYLTALAIARTELFKAAVVQSGIVDWVSHYAQTDVNTGIIRYLGGTPWDNFELYLERSPIAYAGRIRTPTLILHGGEDRRVHIAQSWELYRALKEMGVPCEFVIYRKEGHGIASSEDQLDLMRRVVGWFRRWLLS